MDFSTCLRTQLHLHPSMQPQDLIKLCYQGARGAEHLLADVNRARVAFEREFASVSADTSAALFEQISSDVARVSLAAWKASNLPPEWLFRMFLHTASVPQGGPELLDEYIRIATAFIADQTAIPAEQWQDALTRWQEAGMPAVHHSDVYRAAEQPAYRIVNARFQCIMPILKKLHSAPEVRVLALEGRAASGKTTRAALLSAVLDAPVIHMDDFFLPPALRSADRLAEPGGNVDYDRFAAEVLPGLLGGTAFSYRAFDCSMMDFAGEQTIPAAPIRIVEGSYALHPRFGDYAQLRIFTDISPEMQMERILLRNGERMAELFRTRWIPMEEAYFDTFDIRRKADLIL